LQLLGGFFLILVTLWMPITVFMLHSYKKVSLGSTFLLTSVFLCITLLNNVAILSTVNLRMMSVMKKTALIIIIAIIFPSLLFAKREHPEKWYQVKWCQEHKGQIEVVLPDGTRCDCLTDTHAVEFDF